MNGNTFHNSTATIQVVYDIKLFFSTLQPVEGGDLNPISLNWKNQKCQWSTRLLAYDIKGCYRIMMAILLENNLQDEKYKHKAYILLEIIVLANVN